MKQFSLDLPTTRTINGADRLYGWYIPAHDRAPKLRIVLDGKPYASLQTGGHRADVMRAFPAADPTRAFESGFFGDVPVPAHVGVEQKVRVQIVDEAASNGDRLLYDEHYVMTRAPAAAPRERSFDLRKLMQCGLCGGKLSWQEEAVHCTACNVPAHIHFGVPHALEPGDKALFRMTERTETHPYGPGCLKMLEEFKDRLVLDFGAGNTPVDCLRSNVVNLDVQQYQYTDVIAMTPRLPFADASFDAIISQAVFEHLPFPRETAREFFRVLKPGGKVYIETAFMQPLHGDPSHFFNMTPHAISLVFADFNELDAGVSPHQMPSFGMRMQLESVIPYVQDAVWQARLISWLEFLNKESREFDAALGARGRTKLAAGFYYLGQKSV